MELPWDRLFAALVDRGLAPRGGVSEARLTGAAATLGFDLPPWLVTLYRQFDGLALALPTEAEGVRFEPPMAILPLDRALAWSDVIVYAGPRAVKLFFFAEIESDLLGQFVDGPLAGHIIHLAHDGDGATLWFRHEGEFLDALLALVVSGGTSLEDLRPAMGPSLMTEADVLIGLAASKPDAAGDLDETSRSLLRQLAADLLGGSDEASLGQLLVDDDIYVREKAELNLRRRHDPAARRLLGAYALAFDAFVQRCRATLRLAGWTVPDEPAAEDALITWRALPVDEPGPRIFLGLGMFYELRSQPDFDAWLVQRVKALKMKNSPART